MGPTAGTLSCGIESGGIKSGGSGTIDDMSGKESTVAAAVGDGSPVLGTPTSSCGSGSFVPAPAMFTWTTMFSSSTSGGIRSTAGSLLPAIPTPSAYGTVSPNTGGTYAIAASGSYCCGASISMTRSVTGCAPSTVAATSPGGSGAPAAAVDATSGTTAAVCWGLLAEYSDTRRGP